MSSATWPWAEGDEVFLDWGGYKELGYVAAEHDGTKSLELRLSGQTEQTFTFHPHEQSPGNYRANNGYPVKIWLRHRPLPRTDPPEAA